MHQQSGIDLKDFISQSKIRLKRILDRLEWSEEDTLKNFNANSLGSSPHKVLLKPSSPIKATYPESCISENSIVLGTLNLQEILQNNEVKAPRNFRELQANFSREQKLKIYEHVIENTKKMENDTVVPQAEGEMSLADILAQKKREHKNKKRRFRKSKPTHIEEVRCLVDLQMQSLRQFMGNKIKKDQDEETANNYSLGADYQNRDKRKRYENWYRRERNRETTDDLRRRRKSRSKEYDHHNKYKRHKRSSSRELTHARTRRERSRSKQRKRSESSTKDIHNRRKRRSSRSNSRDRHKSRKSRNNGRRSKSPSNERKKRRSRSYERRNRDHNEDISKEMWDYSKCQSYESCKRIQESDSFSKYSEGRIYFNEKYNQKKYYKKESKNPESSIIKHRSIKETNKNIYLNEEYKNSDINKTTADASLEKYKINILSQSNEKPSSHKSSKHKNRKRDRS